MLTPAAVPIGVALTDTVVIFGDEAGGIFSVPIAGGNKRKIAPTKGQPTHLVIDTTTVYFSDDEATQERPDRRRRLKTLSSDVGFPGWPSTGAG